MKHLHTVGPAIDLSLGLVLGDAVALLDTADELILLAAEESGPRTDWRHITLDARNLAKSIAGDPAALRFSIEGVTFKPFYESYGRYSVYLHVSLK